MFELKPFLESLMKRFEISDIRCIYSTPECVKCLGLPFTNMMPYPFKYDGGVL